ncbi:hypothetical protein CLOHYLEM_04590 [[Clostridium] hylemonae DSM 15053]|uniref:Uncharacterized protein n=1 Tax=[Clostridium] hylemonae DSM 15053 TaxID=553973 RepID=C0BXQ3_9FIRM|nr:hypothetical protein CLOHYLEM_04590 [[Clostridium] hylemonae DSM 15053]
MSYIYITFKAIICLYTIYVNMFLILLLTFNNSLYIFYLRCYN